MTVPGGDPGEKPKDEAQQPPPSGQTPGHPPNGPAESPQRPAPLSNPPGSGYPPPAYPPSGYPPSASYGPPGYQDAAGHPSYPAPPPESGQPYPGEYPPPGYPGGYAHQPKTNTLAIASLIASLVGLLFPISSIVGIVLGAIAVSQIKHTRQPGYGMAVAGIVVGIATVVIYVVFVATLRMHY
jgi:hypothetical protein